MHLYDTYRNPLNILNAVRGMSSSQGLPLNIKHWMYATTYHK